MFVSYSYIAALLEGPLALSRSSVAVAMCAFGIAGIAGNHLASNRVGQRPLALTNAIAAFLVVIGAAMTVFIGGWVVEQFGVAGVGGGRGHMGWGIELRPMDYCPAIREAEAARGE